jgi:DNA-binding NarL/FixJ family response regulator
MDILLASAQSDQRFALEVLLREQPGLAVTGTATGSEGLLALAQSTCPDLVLVNWDLPGRPMADVLAVVCALDCRPQIIVLGRDARDRQAVLAAGADAYVLQGDAPDQLLAAVQQARVQRDTAAYSAVDPAYKNMEGE